jgi:hypothetical protein
MTRRGSFTPPPISSSLPTCSIFTSSRLRRVRERSLAAVTIERVTGC